MSNPNKLFVGNLPFACTQGDLEELFGQFGTVVSVNLITDRMSGRSKGFAFVEFDSEDAAKAAVDALHGNDFQGRNLVVNVARPQEDRPRRDFGGGGRQGGGGGGGYGRDNRQGGGGGGYNRDRSY